MTVRAHYFLSAFAVAAVLGLGSHRGGTEPLNPAGAAPSTVAYDRTSEIKPKLTPATLSTRGGTSVASATSQLDLSKLTLADFGDVEPAR